MEFDKEKISSYVELFTLLRSSVNDEQVAALILEQIAKDARTQLLIQRNGNHKSESDVPATEKQLGYLKSLGADVPAGMTKQQASKMIEQLKAA